MNFVLEANIINGLGTLIGLTSHYLISCTDKRNLGFRFSIVACFLITIGSAILESWPVVALNVIWGLVSIMGYYSGAAWITTIIYVVGFIGLSLQLVERKEYLYWTIIGFLILVPHLIEYFQYSLLFGEVVGAFIVIIGLWKINQSKIYKKI